MKKFLLTLAAVAFAASTLMAQSPTTTVTQEEPDRVQMKAMSKDPSGIDVVTSNQKPEVKKCENHKPGEACTKPAAEQCDDCKAAAAAAAKHECKKGEGHKCEKEAAAQHQCKKGEGHKCEKEAAAQHECKKGEGHKCEKEAAAQHQCKKGEGHKCEKEAAAAKHECKEGKGHECHKAGEACNKPESEKCDDCKNVEAKKAAIKKSGMKAGANKKAAIQKVDTNSTNKKVEKKTN